MGNAQVIVTVDEACAVDASPPPSLSEVWGVATDYTVLGLLARSTKGGKRSTLLRASRSVESGRVTAMVVERRARRVRRRRMVLFGLARA
jgi:hypothetical protein